MLQLEFQPGFQNKKLLHLQGRNKLGGRTQQQKQPQIITYNHQPGGPSERLPDSVRF